MSIFVILLNSLTLLSQIRIIYHSEEQFITGLTCVGLMKQQLRKMLLFWLIDHHTKWDMSGCNTSKDFFKEPSLWSYLKIWHKIDQKRGTLTLIFSPNKRLRWKTAQFHDTVLHSSCCKIKHLNRTELVQC